MSRQWRQRYPEKYRRQTADYRARNHDAILQRQRADYQKHQRKRLAAAARYRKKHVQKLRDAARHWRQTHPHQRKIQKARYALRHWDKILSKNRRAYKKGVRILKPWYLKHLLIKHNLEPTHENIEALRIQIIVNRARRFFQLTAAGIELLRHRS